MDDSRKRKRSDGISDEERIKKKFECLETRLMELWACESNQQSNKEDLQPIESGVTDIVSFVDIHINSEDNLDSDEGEYFDEDEDVNEDEDINEEDDMDEEEDLNERVNETIIEVPYQRPPIEEIYLSDEECEESLKNYEELERSEEEVQKDQDITFLQEKPCVEDHLMRPRKIPLHPDIQETWKRWTRCGIPLKDKRELLEKYTPPKVLKSPEINEEILVTLHKRPIDKDKHMRASQDLLSSALTSLGSTMSSLLVGGDGADRQKVMNGLNDTAKLLTELYHFETDKRRSQIISWKCRPLRPILAHTKPDEFLFGSGLKSKINEAEESGVIAPLKPYEFKRNNNNYYPRKRYPSPYQWYGRDENEEAEEEQNFVLNPLKQEPQFVCKKEEFPIIKLE